MSAEAHLRAWLAELGLNTDPEMDATAERMTAFARLFAEALPPLAVSTCATQSTDPVVVRDLPFYSLCAHHWLPFFGTVSIAYVPSGRLAGLGAFADCVATFARRPQIQERLTAEVADALSDALGATALRVVSRARHLCLEMRHPTQGAEVTVTATRGRSEALAGLL